MQQISPRHTRETRHLGTAGKKAAIHIGEAANPIGQAGLNSGTLGQLDVHGAENFRQHLMGVGAVAFAVLLNRFGKQAIAIKDVSVFCKKTEHQPRHKVVHVGATFVLGPVRVLVQQLDVQLVQAAGGAHVDGVVLDLLDGGDAGQRQQETEVVGKVRVVAGDGFTRDQLFGLQRLPIGGKDKLGLGFCGGRAGAQCLERFAHATRLACGDMNVAAQ
ncbi:hypothetical protein D3C84_803460 [compost metagenome]